MTFTYKKANEIEGDLDIFTYHNKENYDGEFIEWDVISIHGNSKGLKSFAKLLIEIAELNQEEVEDKYLPPGARKHYHLRPNIELSKSSMEVIVGRLDAKVTGDYYDRFIQKEK